MFRRKRSVTRFERRIRVLYRTKTGERGVMNIVPDFSRKGLGFFSNRSFAVGALLGLEVFLPWDVEPIAAIGRVTRIKGRGTFFEGGIIFTMISEKDRERIESGWAGGSA